MADTENAPPPSSEATAPRAVIPRATYRLQLNRTFTFRDATALVPYLAELGISHVYCSPYLRARPGSMHGYDIVDHNALNPEIGTPAEFEQFVATLRAHRMGHILDFVPNHVGVMGADNAWWMDVLEHGKDSRYAEFFDIDWSPPNPALAGKLLVPALGEPYGEILEKGELQLRWEPQTRSLAVFYHDHRFPIDPRTWPEAVKRAVGGAPGAGTIEDAVAALSGTPGDPHSFDALHNLLEAQSYRLAYWRVASDDINYRRFFDVNDLAALRMENAQVFEATHRLVLQLIAEGQLDGLRIDHPDGLYDPQGYFERLQRAVLRATAGAKPVAATEPVRADTPGGPRPMTGAPGPEHSARGGISPLSPDTLPLYLVVEKITASFERLPQSWPVHGTTGYNFANLVNGVFVDARAKARLDRIYSTFITDYAEWADVAFDSKVLVLRTSLAAELNVIANQLARIAQADRHTRDFTLSNLRQVLTEVIACFPVYRTYVTDRASDDDRRFIDWAIGRARRRGSSTDVPLLDFVRAMLLADTTDIDPSIHADVRAFAGKFQQVTAPVTAKGVEDTALYRFTRLVSLNEVGGEPETFGFSVRQFHADAQYRLKSWPHEMLGTSTHDTKRAEDVRARIDVLSEMPSLWRKSIQRWTRMNRIRRRIVDDLPAPGPHAEYLLYQTLLGTWPLAELDDAAFAAYRERIEEYMVKASREAKRRTSWANINPDYEDALRQFIRLALERREGNLFPVEVGDFARRIARFGFLNSLAQTLCKLTAPGVPDIYQGSEIWDDSLVDPDNRRPVDYDLRRRLLAEVRAWGGSLGGAPSAGTEHDSPGSLQGAGGAAAPGLVRNVETPGSSRELLRAALEHLDDGRCKLYVTHQALQFRRENEALFREGAYVPLPVAGEHAQHILAYARRNGDSLALVAVPRLTARLLGGRDTQPLGEAVWADTRIEIPHRLRSGVSESTPLRNVLGGHTVIPARTDDGPCLHAADVFATCPVALLARA